MEADESFGRWLKVRRQSRDLTQERLADKVGCALSTMEKIERGRRRPSRQVAERLADALGLSAAEREAFIAWARGSAPPLVGPGESAPPASALQPATNLPATLTALVGRDQEVVLVRNLLWRADVRLLTLTGPPGVGKTRLSLAVAAGLQGEFTDGVWLVLLAAVRDPPLVAATISQTLGLKETPAQQTAVRLRDYLRDKQMLLVLDNFEQVLAAAPLLTNLLSGAPRLKILVSSRADLHVYGEHTVPVAPLAVPDLAHPLPLGDLAAVPAVALFVQRAQAVQRDFALTAANASAVADLCARLDGLPLALELAAARSRLFTPAAMLARLTSRLALLTGGPADHPARQQTLRGAVTWSYELLTPEAQALFRRLAVFSGGWTLDTAVQVTADQQAAGSGQPPGASDDRLTKRPHPAPQNTQDATLSGLTTLTAQSLIRREPGADGEPRFAMLETIREYALERLIEAGEEAPLRTRHAAVFLTLAQQAEVALRGPRQLVELARLEQEHPNLRAALGWAIAGGDTETALRLSSALVRFWYTHGHGTEGLAWLERVLALPGPATAARGQAFNAAGSLAYYRGEYARAKAFYEQGLAVARTADNQKGAAASLNNLGLVALDQGEYEQAGALYEESLALYREMTLPVGVAAGYDNLALVAYAQGDIARARQLADEALTLRQTQGDERMIALSLNTLAQIVLEAGDPMGAADLAADAVARFRTLGDRWGSARALANLARALDAQGDPTQATVQYRASLALFREVEDRWGFVRCLEGLAGVALATESGKLGAERAIWLLSSAARLRELIGLPLPPVEQPRHTAVRDAAQARLGADGLAAAWAAGQALTLDAALTLAAE